MREEVKMEPFVVSTMTVPHESAMKVINGLDKIAVRRGFARETIARIKLALVRFETFRRKSLNARQAAGSFDIIPMSQSESGESDEE